MFAEDSVEAAGNIGWGHVGEPKQDYARDCVPAYRHHPPKSRSAVSNTRCSLRALANTRWSGRRFKSLITESNNVVAGLAQKGYGQRRHTHICQKAHGFSYAA